MLAGFAPAATLPAVRKIAWPIVFQPVQASQHRGFDFAYLLGSRRAYFGSSQIVVDNLSVRLLGAESSRPGEGLDREAGTANEYSGRDRSRWRQGIPLFGRVRYQGVYPGIDVIYYGREGNLEFDFVVHPGADPRKIVLDFEPGAEPRLAENGDLLAGPAGRRMRFKAPAAYQGPDRQTVAVRYRSLTASRCTFELGSYDSSRKLVIDPLVFIYLDPLLTARAPRVDESGNLTLFTSANNPGSVDNNNDLVFAKLSPQGELLSATYIRTKNSEQLYDTAFDAAGNLYAAGLTFSSDFPATTAPPSTGRTGSFILKLDPSGKLLYAYVIPSRVDNPSIGIDPAGQVFLSGLIQTFTLSAPTTPDASQTDRGQGNAGYLFKLNAPGTAMLYGSYVGKLTGGQFRSLAPHQTGALVAQGSSCDPSALPALIKTKAPNSNSCLSFLGKLAPSLDRFLWAITLPNYSDFPVRVDSRGRVVFSQILNLDTASGGALPDQLSAHLGRSVIARVDADGKNIEILANLSAIDIALDEQDNIYAAGTSYGSDPTRTPTPGITQAVAWNQSTSAFIAKFDSSGRLVFSTGPRGLPELALSGISVDRAKRIYATGTPLETEYSLDAGAVAPQDVRWRQSFILRVDPPSGTAVAIHKVSGDNQTAVLGHRTPRPLEVEAVDAAGDPVSGAAVRFQGGRTGAPSQVVYTDARGRAQATPLMDDGPGDLTVLVSMEPLDPASFKVRVRLPPQTPQIPAAQTPPSIPRYSVVTVAGRIDRDKELAESAPLVHPNGIVVDPAGNVFFVEELAWRVRQVVAADGTLRTIAGSSQPGDTGDGGPATEATFKNPNGVALDAKGDFYVTDFGTNRIRKISRATGVIDQFASIPGPAGICADPSGNLFVASPREHRVRRVTPAGQVSVVAGVGSAGFNGDGQPAVLTQLQSPERLACDGKGSVYVTEAFSGGRVRRIDPNGTIKTIAGGGRFPGAPEGQPATLAYLNPRAVAVDRNDNVYVGVGNKVLKVDRNGTYTSVVPANTFEFTNSATADGLGNVYVTDSSQRRVVKLFEGVSRTFAGGDIPSGPATSLLLYRPEGVTGDQAGNLYVADTGSDRVRRVDARGGMTTVAGDLRFRLNLPVGLVTDSSANLYFSDAFRIWKRDPSGKVEPVAGIPGGSIFLGDPARYSLIGVRGLAIDRTGTLLAFEEGSPGAAFSPASGILRIRPEFVHVIGGGRGPGYGGDGEAAVYSTLNQPRGPAVDRDGNIYFADSWNHRVRRIGVDGRMTTVAGTGTAGFSGDGGAGVRAALSYPNAVAVDPSNNIFIADTNNHRIRILTPEGIIYTAAGTGESGFSGDGGLALAAKVSFPRGLFADAGGNVFVCDTGNHLIRKLTPGPVTVAVAPTANPASQQNGPIAPGQLVRMDGRDLTPGSEDAPAAPLPFSLGGVTLELRDGLGTRTPVPLLTAAPARLRFFVPANLLPGSYTLALATIDGGKTELSVAVESSAPGLFTANLDGLGAPVASVSLTAPDGATSTQFAFRCGTLAGSCLPAPIRLIDGGSAQLTLFGTGFRNAEGRATVTLDSVAADIVAISPLKDEPLDQFRLPTPSLFLGPPAAVGLDVLTVRVPLEMAGRGAVELRLTVEGRTANPVTIEFQ